MCVPWLCAVDERLDESQHPAIQQIRHGERQKPGERKVGCPSADHLCRLCVCVQTGDGRLNVLELFLLSISRPHPFIFRLSNARAKMHQFDRDHDGFLDFNEYEASTEESAGNCAAVRTRGCVCAQDMALEDGLERQVEDAFRKYDQSE